ncbi:TetR/AcrR family transcriptional regulator [Streptomyces sp. I05A-00742]|uniref:TetR/AcrR family transcriptional regulator n=1 Tax=Streptomyces sp. I05A-00742 TaxID=2732853 RepID=UPI001488BD5E|nr:TetR/AcrR family transcriptional regulator [Streptomyces sp. I05A-00742]
MAQGQGLRERKKEQTRRALGRTAIELFLERGYDNVSVAEIAAATEVSKMTVFNYVHSKEDLVLGPMEEHVADAARAVRDRRPGESVVAAFRRQFLDALALHDASVGFDDQPRVLAIRRLIDETPALRSRALMACARSQQLLEEELAAAAGEEGGELAPVAAAMLMGARNALISYNRSRLLAGDSAETAYPDAVAMAERAFAMVESGLGAYARATSAQPAQ